MKKMKINKKTIGADILTILAIVLPILLGVRICINASHGIPDSYKAKNLFTNQQAFEAVTDWAFGVLEQEQMSDGAVDKINIWSVSAEGALVDVYHEENTRVGSHMVAADEETVESYRQIRESFRHDSRSGLGHIEVREGEVSFCRDGNFVQDFYRLTYVKGDDFPSERGDRMQLVPAMPGWYHVLIKRYA